MISQYCEMPRHGQSDLIWYSVQLNSVPTCLKKEYMQWKSSKCSNKTQS